MSYPQDPHYPQYPSQWEPPRPRKRSRAGIWIAVIVVDLLAIGLVAVLLTNRASTEDAGDEGVVAGETGGTEGWDGGTGASPGAIPEETPEPEPEPARIGDKVRDGDFSITVTRMSRAETLGESEFSRIEAKGEYVVFHATVRNHRDKSRLFLANSQDLFIGSKRYETVLFLEFKGFLKKIPPGKTMKGIFAFDVPKGAEPTHLVLHDDPTSPGATVRLEG